MREQEKGKQSGKEGKKDEWKELIKTGKEEQEKQLQYRKLYLNLNLTQGSR